MIQMIKKYAGILGIVVSFLILYSCEKIKPEIAAFSELGTASSVYTVPHVEGDTVIQVLSNGKFDIIVSDSTGWLSTDAKHLYGDTGFAVHYNNNPDFPRMGYVILADETNERYDTITVKQKGIKTPELTFPEPNIRVMGDGGEVIAKVETNLSIEDLSIEVIYPGEEGNDNFEGWINNNFELNSAQNITFSVKPNQDQNKLRSAQIRITYGDGWEGEDVSTFYLLQANAQNLFGTKASFMDVRSLAGGEISSDIFIEGYVVSDVENENENVGDNPQTTPTKIDYSQNKKTVYIQSEDGKYGFRILTSTEEDNVFNRFSKVQLLLKGATVSQDPSSASYTIKDVTASMVMSQVAGSANNISEKEKYISELTDDDIYTYVTLKDCELPIRKGSFTPVNEGYTTLFGASRISKYPLLMRDIQGSSIYMLVNMTVPWRRTGEILPQGAGTVSGIIVHEHFTRFSFEDAANPDEYGNIGQYQIRPLTREEIEVNKDLNNGFSQLLVEYRFPNIKSGVAYPTNDDQGENGKLYPSNHASVYASTDYTYLGPCGNDNKGNLNQWGNGVLINGLKQNTSSATNNTGKGETSSSSIASSRVWWDYAKDRGEAWILEFSTAGISTNHLSLQFAAMNWSSSGGPRYWAVEWSDNANMDGQWKRIATYTVPDVSNWSNTLLTQMPGFKNVDVELPLSLLGKNKVYIRLIVDKNLSSDGYSYASEPISNAVNSALSYLAVRYNK